MVPHWFILYRGRPPEGGHGVLALELLFQLLKEDALRHLSRDLLILQNLIECPANDFVAFARSGFQPPAVDDLDSPASIFYEMPRLQRLCDQCHTRSAQSQHIGQPFLAERDDVILTLLTQKQ